MDDTRLRRFDWQAMDALRQELIAQKIPLHFHEYPEWRAWWAEQTKRIDEECPPTESDLRQRQQYFDNPGSPGISLGGMWSIDLWNGELVVYYTLECTVNLQPAESHITHLRIPLHEPQAIERLIRWLQDELPEARRCPEIPKGSFNNGGIFG